MNRLRLAPPFPRGVGRDNQWIAFTTHLGLLYQKSRGVYLLRPIRPLLVLQQMSFWSIGMISGFVALSALYDIVGGRYNTVYQPTGRESLIWVFVICFPISIVCFWLLGRIGNKYNKKNVFGKEISQYYQLILNINLKH